MTYRPGLYMTVGERERERGEVKVKFTGGFVAHGKSNSK